MDGLLREQLDRFENAELAPAVRLLFGAEATTSGATLTARRRAAAMASGYEVNHFRKRIEPKLAALVAWQLRRDSEEFDARHATAPRLHAPSGPLHLPEDVFAWEATEHQHAVAVLWGAVYLLRAELLTVARLVSMGAPQAEADQAAMRALWRHALVLTAVARYHSAYGANVLHAAVGLSPLEIATYAGWTPSLTPTQNLLLAELADPAGGLADFAMRLEAGVTGRALITEWLQALSAHPSEHQQAFEEKVTIL
ncbi:hypothetical protein DP939_08410 [Spongiactinospora rosea]|uniref:Uncharacterized protein n=1 Tax=Spongiactinospora rosea TaxID=2248750 RepID=A0A366M5H2_9ACTN|nr:hypothetical protein DP939_08410 [Spongiactinospora rosea]